METSIGAAGVLQVAGEAEIGATEELRKALLQWLAREHGAAIDLSQVESCDAAAVQLLVSLRKTASCMHKDLVLKGASDAVREAFAALGIPMDMANGEHRAQ